MKLNKNKYLCHINTKQVFVFFTGDDNLQAVIKCLPVMLRKHTGKKIL